MITPSLAGERLSALSRDHDFVLFEYWKTDKAGHAMNRPEAVGVLETFDGMLGGILGSIDTQETLLVITSDHGNIEDLTTKTHTRHPVPLVICGAGAGAFAGGFGPESDLTAVTPLLMEFICPGP